MLEFITSFRVFLAEFIPLWVIQCAGFSVIVYQQSLIDKKFQPLKTYYSQLYKAASPAAVTGQCSKGKVKSTEKWEKAAGCLDGLGEVFLGFTEALMILGFEKYDLVTFCIGFLVSFIYKIPLVKLNAKYSKDHPNPRRAGIIRTIVNIIPAIAALATSVFLKIEN